MNDTLSQPASDEHLMLAFSQGSPESFTELFRRYKLPIYGLFRRYLYAIALKILCAHRRKAAFRATFLGHRGSNPDPSRRDATESALWVRRALAKLDSTDREILMLREFEQLSYAEIADVLQLPLNTVRSRLSPCRKS